MIILHLLLLLLPAVPCVHVVHVIVDLCCVNTDGMNIPE
jgi:hypothetical protein